MKSTILLVGTGVWKISSVAYGSISIKSDYSDHQKSLISRIVEVYVFFNTNLLKKTHINFIYNRFFCCNYTCYYVNMVSVTSASHYITSASL